MRDAEIPGADPGSPTTFSLLRPPSTLAADAGMTVLRVALQRWAGGDDERELAIVMRDCVAELQTVATSGCA